MLLVGLIHIATNTYSGEFLRIMSTVSPGTDTAPKIGRVFLGTVYGFVDGAVVGFQFGLLNDASSAATDWPPGSCAAPASECSRPVGNQADTPIVESVCES
jgi:hypothetical protein